MRIQTALLFWLFFTAANAQPFTWNWSVSDTSTLSTPDVQGMATDALGNSYITGQFYGTASFGNLPPITSVGQSDVFIVKYDNSGTALWAMHGGGTDFDDPSDLALDAEGNVLITGTFYSPTATFGADTHTRVGAMDIFVAKVNGADGSFLWSHRFGSNDFQSGHAEHGNAVACDSDGNIYLSGAFKYTLEVVGLPTLDGCSQYYTSFLMKLDPDGNGIWSRRTDCTRHWSYGAVEGQQLTISSAGDLYLGLRARGDTIFYETDTIINQQLSGQAHDVILAKYDLDGNYQWARQIGGYGYDDAQALAADAEGNIYIAVHREGSYGYLGIPGIDFSGSLGTYRNVVLKYTAEGNLLWGVRLGNSTYDHDIEAMLLEGPEQIVVAGWHQGNFQFDDVVPNPGTGGSYGLFVARYDSSGVLGDYHAARYQYPRGIRGMGCDGGGNLYLAGYFQDSLSFPGLPVMDLATSSSSALFVARSGNFPTSLTERNAATSMCYPNPSNGTFTMQSEQPFTELRIVNTLGAVVYHERFAPTTSHALELVPQGVFAYSLLHKGSVVAHGRMVVQR